MEWTDVEAERVEIRLAGSGEIEMSGETTELAIELDGSGSVDVAELQAQSADVAIGGSGDVDISVRDSLSAGSAEAGVSPTPATHP